MPTLILTPRYTEDAQALWRAAGRRGWAVRRLTTWRVTDDDRAAPDPVFHLDALMAPMQAAEFGYRLLEPAEDFLPQLPTEYRLREVWLTTLGEARTLPEPRFVKPPNDKSFPARVYAGAELPNEFADDVPVLVSEVVTWGKEFRCFVLNRDIATLSVYLRDGVLQRDDGFTHTPAEEAEVREFAGRVLADPRVDFPVAGVLDVGTIAGTDWAVVEANSAWGAGLYGCDPDTVLEVLQAAAVPA